MTTLDEILATVDAPLGQDDDDIPLSSLQLLVLVEELESAFSIRLGLGDVTRAHFQTRRALRALLASKGIACG